MAIPVWVVVVLTGSPAPRRTRISGFGELPGRSQADPSRVRGQPRTVGHTIRHIRIHTSRSQHGGPPRSPDPAACFGIGDSILGPVRRLAAGGSGCRGVAPLLNRRENAAAGTALGLPDLVAWAGRLVWASGLGVWSGRLVWALMPRAGFVTLGCFPARVCRKRPARLVSLPLQTQLHRGHYRGPGFDWTRPFDDGSKRDGHPQLVCR